MTATNILKPRRQKSRYNLNMRRIAGQLRLHREYWLVAHIDPELGRYYREGFNRANRFVGVKVGDTHWGPHVSIVRNEEPPRLALWNLYHERDIEFYYEPVYKTNGKHIWFDVICDEMMRIRERLGLKQPPFYNLHLTLGTYHRTSDADPTVIRIPPSLLVAGEIQEVTRGEPSNDDIE